MYVIELHDAEVDNETQGSLAAHIGRTGTIGYAYQAEMHLQDILEERWRRAYLKTDGKIMAIWARDMQTGAVSYLARAPEYNGEWELPFVGAPDARIAVASWDHDVTTDADALAWATAQLATAITAVVMERGEIRAAWTVTRSSWLADRAIRGRTR